MFASLDPSEKSRYDGTVLTGGSLHTIHLTFLKEESVRQSAAKVLARHILYNCI